MAGDPKSKYQEKYGKRKDGIPEISSKLDSIRSFQFEVHFEGVPRDGKGDSDDLTLAAKQVSPVGFSVYDIEVFRVNDKVFYPGRPGPEEVTITFDNMYAKYPTHMLWAWFKSIYDPTSGELTKGIKPGGDGASFKATSMDIIMLKNNVEPHSTVRLYGVYPKSWKTAEFNYATNDFHTLEVTFRYDFMDYEQYATGIT